MHKYEQALRSLLANTYPSLTRSRKLEFKNVFGAVGIFVDGHIFASSGKFGIALRLPQEVLTKLFRDNQAKHLKYFRQGHIKKEYAVISPIFLRTKRKIKPLVHKSVQYTLSLFK